VGSANLAGPKSPDHGVWAIHLVPGPQAETSRVSKFSSKASVIASRSRLSSGSAGADCTDDKPNAAGTTPKAVTNTPVVMTAHSIRIVVPLNRRRRFIVLYSRYTLI